MHLSNLTNRFLQIISTNKTYLNHYNSYTDIKYDEAYFTDIEIKLADFKIPSNSIYKVVSPSKVSKLFGNSGLSFLSVVNSEICKVYEIHGIPQNFNSYKVKDILKGTEALLDLDDIFYIKPGIHKLSILLLSDHLPRVLDTNNDKVSYSLNDEQVSFTQIDSQTFLVGVKVEKNTAHSIKESKLF